MLTTYYFGILMKLQKYTYKIRNVTLNFNFGHIFSDKPTIEIVNIIYNQYILYIMMANMSKINVFCQYHISLVNS